jgi:hypothetical protein
MPTVDLVPPGLLAGKVAIITGAVLAVDGGTLT